MKETMSSNKFAIEVKDLRKAFGEVKVLNGINFSVEQGSIMALLGPNGAGKTTTIRMLSTLMTPDEGSAMVNGYDVVKKSDDVRRSIGLTGQFAAVDEYLTGEENLYMMGQLYHMGNQKSRARTVELLEQFDLVEAGKRPVRTYSGGMKRRLDLAMSLIAGPPVIFLDEPTTGLDPRSRLTMWETIKRLAKTGTTIFLTTQYMEEADHLADRIIVLDGGQVIAEGTADDLKAKIGSDRLEIIIGKDSDFEKARMAIDGDSLQVDEERRTLSVASKRGVTRLKEVLQALENANVEVDSISLHRPTLDDVFLTLTGHAATKEAQADDKKAKGKN